MLSNFRSSTFVRILKRSSYMMASLSLVVLVSSPSVVLADTTPSSSTTTVCPSSSGTTSPTGASASTFSYDSKTCLWVNSYYSWNPVTKIYTPLVPLVYTYDQTTNMYNSSQWIFNPVANKYEQQSFSVSQPPAGAVTVGSPTVSSSNTSSSSTSSSNSSSSSSSVLPTSSNNPNTNGSNSSLNLNSNNQANLNDNNTTNVNNNLKATSSSGNALVLGNSQAGNATSGNSINTATIVNSIASDPDLAGAPTFTANINGNVNSNLVFNPLQIFQPASGTNALTSNTNNQITINQTSNSTLNNNINLAANSGNATVADNTSAGSATTGNASSVANVVNMIDSMISSKKSFVGVINILGDLNGNILIPQQFLNGLIASNAPRSTYAVNTNQLTTADVTNNNNQTINNNINASASTGTANVSKNTAAGSATSGNATTNVTVFNLTGDNVNAANSMLIFVNVLGSWVGMILNAPSGTTSALLGQNATVNSNTNNTLNSTNTNNQTINNNINLKSNSGNALVSENTAAGNATSGNASSSANIANLTGDNLDLTNWFGILFINVFGKWLGSIGIFNPLAISNSTSSSSNPSDVKVLPVGFRLNPQKTIIDGQSIAAVNNPSAIMSIYQAALTNAKTSSTSTATNKPSLSRINLASDKQLTKVALADSPQLKKLPNNKADIIFAISAVGLGLVLFTVDFISRKRKLTNTK